VCVCVCLSLCANNNNNNNNTTTNNTNNNNMMRQDQGPVAANDQANVCGLCDVDGPAPTRSTRAMAPLRRQSLSLSLPFSFYFCPPLAASSRPTPRAVSVPVTISLARTRALFVCVFARVHAQLKDRGHGCGGRTPARAIQNVFSYYRILSVLLL